MGTWGGEPSCAYRNPQIRPLRRLGVNPRNRARLAAYRNPPDPTPAAPGIPVPAARSGAEGPTSRKLWEFGEFRKFRELRKSPKNHGGAYGARGAGPDVVKPTYASC